jgi:hypothetical protein
MLSVQDAFCFSGQGETNDRYGNMDRIRSKCARAPLGLNRKKNCLLLVWEVSITAFAS